MIEKWSNNPVKSRRVRYYEDDEGSIVSKQCTKCNELKSVKGFTKASRGLGGYSSRCRLCDERYRIENKERTAEYKRLYYKDNREREDERVRNWNNNNKDRKAEINRKWWESNKSNIKESQRIWRSKNRDKCQLKNLRRRARKTALPDDMTIEQQTKIFRFFDGGCALTGDKKQIHIDHVIPLSTGYGGTTYVNMIPLRSDLNISKSNLNIFEWFYRNKKRFDLSQERFSRLINYLSEINEMTPEEYCTYVYNCHDKKGAR